MADRTKSLFDVWVEYCVKADELALLVLRAQTQYDADLEQTIKTMRSELNQILDSMIGGIYDFTTEPPTEDTHIINVEQA